MNICNDHPKYKGIRKPKSCKKCLEIYNEINKKQGEYGKYRSLSNQGMSCGLPHLLSELSVYMIYGRQPEFFWRKNSIAEAKVRDQYKKAYTLIQIEMKRNPDLFRDIDRLLYLIYGQFQRSNIIKESFVVEEKKSSSNELVNALSEGIDNIRQNGIKDKATFFDFFNDKGGP